MITPEAFAAALARGKENAVNAPDLARKLDISRRQVSRAAHEARKAGFLVASCNHGYYIPKNREELQEFYSRSRRQAVSFLAVLKTARKTLQEKAEHGNQ